MTIRVRNAVPLVVIVAMVAGCDTNQQSGQAIGGVTGATIGGLLGDALGGDDTSRAVGLVVGGLAGASIGGAIGARLDARDRQQAAAATQAALELQEERNARAAAEARAARAEADAARAQAEAARARATSAAQRQAAEQAERDAAEARRRAQEAEDRAVAQPARTTWSSDSGTGARGGATVTSSAGDNCYTVREVAVIPGQGEVAQNQRYCKQGGRWQAV
jgi:multidrug efflux pump subunit AcrA (membrane-fusion protein)